MTEQEMINVLVESKNGNQESFEILINYFKKYIYKLAHVFFIAGGDMDDVIQHGYIGVYKAVHSYDGNKNTACSPFIKMCIRREVQTAVRNGTRLKHSFLNESQRFECEVNNENTGIILADVIPDERIIEDDYINKERYGLLYKAIDSMTQIQRQCIQLHVRGYKVDDISKILNLNYKQVDNAIFRSKRYLKKNVSLLSAM